MNLAHRVRSILCVVLLVGAASRHAAGQPADEPRFYAGGGLTVAVQPEESADGHYLIETTVGGVSAGAHVTAGFHLSPLWSLSGEVSLPGSVSGDRLEYVGSGYSEVVVNHREPIISALVRRHMGSGRWRVEPAGGFSWVIAHTEETGQLRSPDPSLPPIPLESEDRETLLALTGGVDAPGLASARVAITPFVRVHWVQRPERPVETVTGLPLLIYRAGVVVMGRW